MSTAFDLETFNTKNDLHNFNTLSGATRLVRRPSIADGIKIKVPEKEWDDFITFNKRFEGTPDESGAAILQRAIWIDYKKSWPLFNRECKVFFNAYLSMRRNEKAQMRWEQFVKEWYRTTPSYPKTDLKLILWNRNICPIGVCLKVLKYASMLIDYTHRKWDEVDEDFLAYTFGRILKMVEVWLSYDLSFLESERWLMNTTFNYVLTDLYKSIENQKSLTKKDFSAIGTILAKKINFDEYEIENDKLTELRNLIIEP